MEMTPSEAIERAQAVEETCQSRGWKYIMEMIAGLQEKEILALMGQVLDASYYKRIGMLQAMQYIQEMSTLLSNPEVRSYLLHQGRAVGFETLRKAPQLFFDGRQQGKQIMQRLNGNQDEEGLKKQFLDETYKQS